MSLIEDIQRLAIDSEKSAGDLLRRVKLVAAKLKLTEALEWVDHELNGYWSVAIEDMPSYRIAFGTLYASNRFQGAFRAHGDAESIAHISMTRFDEPIGALEQIRDSDSPYFTLSIDPAFASQLPSDRLGTTYELRFSKNAIAVILENVRNLALNWAIKLEEQGITGEGVNFTMEEKEKAEKSAPMINIVNVNGGVSGDQNRLGAGYQDSSSNVKSVDIFTQLQTAIEQGISDQGERAKLIDLIKELTVKKGQSGFKDAYNRFLLAAGAHMTVISPFLPALGALLP